VVNFYSMKTSVMKFYALAAMLITLLAFQNCSRSQTPNGTVNDKVAEISYSGNGDGYDGKPYIRFSTDGLCPDGSAAEAEVRVNNDRAALVRQDCREISPLSVKVADLNLLPHNLNNLVFENRVFDLDPSLSGDKRPTDLLCRGGDEITKKNGIRVEVADFIIKKNDKGNASGKLVMSISDSAKVKDGNYDSGEFDLAVTTTPNSLEYSGKSSKGYALDITLDTLNSKGVWSGQMHFESGKGSQLPNYTILVSCYPR